MWSGKAPARERTESEEVAHVSMKGTVAATIMAAKLLGKSHPALEDRTPISLVRRLSTLPKPSEPSPLIASLTSKWKNHTERMVISLIQNHADVNARLESMWDEAIKDFKQSLGATPIYFAARMGCVDVCKALVVYEADVNAQSDEGYTALMAAAQNSQVSAMKFLFDARADTSIRDRHGFDVADYAVMEGADVLQVVIDQEIAEDASYEASTGHRISPENTATPKEVVLPPIPSTPRTPKKGRNRKSVK